MAAWDPTDSITGKPGDIYSPSRSKLTAAISSLICLLRQSQRLSVCLSQIWETSKAMVANQILRKMRKRFLLRRAKALVSTSAHLSVGWNFHSAADEQRNEMARIPAWCSLISPPTTAQDHNQPATFYCYWWRLQLLRALFKENPASRYCCRVWDNTSHHNSRLAANCAAWHDSSYFHKICVSSMNIHPDRLPESAPTFTLCEVEGLQNHAVPDHLTTLLREARLDQMRLLAWVQVSNFLFLIFFLFPPFMFSPQMFVSCAIKFQCFISLTRSNPISGPNNLSCISVMTQ